jgi:hypothetical protein
MKKRQLLFVVLLLIATASWASDGDGRTWFDEVLAQVGLGPVDGWGVDIEPTG